MTVKSPCIAACCLNVDWRFCVSCGRSLQDIRDWSAMTDEQKQKANIKAGERLHEQSNTK